MENCCKIILELQTKRRIIKCVGAAYFKLTQLKDVENQHKHNKNAREQQQQDDDNTEAVVVDIDYLRSLNPKEWKDQDHYHVLGLSHLRSVATDDHVRRAYRRMVLQHHPDKRKAKGEEVNQDTDYFTCITKAYETLGTIKTRRAYDSVDPNFDDNLPTTQEIDKDYYGIFNKYFELNARWSEKQPVPKFGDAHAERVDVDRFYNFWYDFKSWREFSYLDEEDKEKGHDRDERRWIEKENKVQRIKRKKEEMQRIRALVDLAYNNDKRIDKFREEDKQRKLAAKKAKISAAQAVRVTQERAAREAQLERERAEKAEQKRIEQIRIEREQVKRALKKERKLLRERAKEYKYFICNDHELINNMEAIERLCENLTLTELQELNLEFQQNITTTNNQGHEIFHKNVKALDMKLQQQQEEQLKQEQKQNAANYENGKLTKTTTTVNGSITGVPLLEHNTINVNAGTENNNGKLKEINKKDKWTNDNVQLLIKAVNLFPAGTAQRWDVVSAFINQHATNDVGLTARDVLNQAKAMQQSDFSKSALKKQANEMAYDSFAMNSKKLDITPNGDITLNDNNNQHMNGKITTSIKIEDCDITRTAIATTTTITPQTTVQMNGFSNNHQKINYAITKSTSNTNINNATTDINASATATATTQGNGVAGTWTMEEQALLEQAIKTYPISTPDRWDRISTCIPNRSKKDCLRRVKELVELVNAKKDAQSAVK